MHQSGQLRAQSMHTVQLSSRSAMTPRARVGGASFSLGYWTVSAPWVTVRPSVFNVTPMPFRRPGIFGLPRATTTPPPSTAFPGHAGRSWTVARWRSLLRTGARLHRHLQDRRRHDVGEGQGDQELPGEPLQLVLSEAGTEKRTHMMRNDSTIILANMISGPATFIQSATSSSVSQLNQLNGTPQPPRNSTAAISENTPTVANSAMKKIRKRKPEYSVM